MHAAEIQKWGNSSAVRLPSVVLRQVNASLGDRLNMEVQGGKIVLAPAPKGYDLAAMVAAITPDNRHDVVDFGSPVGREAW